jgi:signal transduction histidine kinase
MLDVGTDPEYVPIVAGMYALIVLPLISRQQLIGILNLETAQQDVFSQDTLDTLNLLAVRVAVAIDNARAYEELERLVDELDAFDRTVAHDLKNPLIQITGYSDLLVDDPNTPLPEGLDPILRTIANTSHKMADIINALLLLSRLRAKEEVDIQDVDMQPLVRSVQERLSFLINQRHAKIECPSIWPIARGYAPWIEEIWSNYMSNALKYGGTPPLIEIGGTVQPDNMVRFWVRDNGHGLTPEEQAKLFTPFTRLSQVQIEGHGLGLSIVRRIVEKLGGQVGIESRVGEGSTFAFTLPHGGVAHPN